MADDYDPNQSSWAKHAELMHAGMLAFSSGNFESYIQARFQKAVDDMEAAYNEFWSDPGTTSEESEQVSG